MQAHPFFPGIQLHTDEELVSLLGSGLVERETIHQWPLSCVQKLVLADGRRLAYKSQLPPTVEVAFYESAVSPLLPGHQALGKLGNCDILTLEWIEAPLLGGAALDEERLVRHGRLLLAEITAIGGQWPVSLNIGSPVAWLELVDFVLDSLKILVADRRFSSVRAEDVEGLESWAKSEAVLAEIARGPGLCHGDLMARQVFVTEGGYKLIDWQRPVLGPPEIDLVCLLSEAGIEARRYVAETVVGVFWFLRLQWAVEAQYSLFPEFKGTLFNQWAAEAVGGILR